MRRGIFVLIGLLAFSAAAAANTIIVKDPVQRYRIISSDEIIYSQDNNQVWGAAKTKEALSLLYSIDLGKSFQNIPAPLSLKNSQIKSYAIKNNTSHIIYETSGTYYYVYSNDKGISFSLPLALKLNLEGFDQLEELALYIDRENKPNLFTIISNNGSYRINRGENGPLYIQNEEIKELALLPIEETNAVIISFKNGIDGDNYWSAHMDNGQNISPPQKIPANNETPLGLFYDRQKLYWASEQKINEILIPSPPQAEFESPKTKSSINGNKLKIKLKQTGIPYKIDLGLNEKFSNDSALSFYSSAEGEISIPFSSESFYVRAMACDGISFGKPSTTLKIDIDKDPPRIKNIEYPMTINKETFNIKIDFTEPVTYESLPVFSLGADKLDILSLKTEGPSMEAQLKIISMKEGLSELKINNIYDNAGNMFLIDTKLGLSVDRQSPVIEITRPKNNEWYKPDATIVLEANITDQQDDIAANPETKLAIDGQIYTAKIMYSKKNSKLTSFISLPQTIKNGKHQLELEIKDSAGHTGRDTAVFAIDSAAPRAAYAVSPTEERSKVTLACIETGSGVDPDSSIIRITLASLEVFGTIEAKESSVFFYPKETLIDGKYEIKTVLRDKVGNTGEEQALVLLVKEGASAQSAVKNAAITDLRFGPNPFNPESQNWQLSCSLNAAEEIGFFVFTLTGKNIFRATSAASTTHNITWNGKDQFGTFVPNGVYLFAILRGSDIQRGKLIVLR